MTLRKSSNGPGNFPKQIRMKPKIAAFEITPESTAATSGDDSRYASGSQPWNGKSGALTAKAIAKPRKSQVLLLGPVLDEVERVLREPEDDDRREHQQRARHRVDDELDVAPSRPGPPQTPIRT